jgi:hypothetical protein
MNELTTPMTTALDNGWNAYATRALERQAAMGNAPRTAVQQIEFAMRNFGGARVPTLGSSSVAPTA